MRIALTTKGSTMNITSEVNEQVKSDTPKIYVACLASYNNGELYGKWIEATQEADKIKEDIALMLKKSNQPNAEEWAIHGTGGFYEIPISEWHDLEEVSKIAQTLEEFKSNRYFADKVEVFSYLMKSEDFNTAIFMLQDAYIGSYESPNDFIHDYIDSCGSLSDCSEWIKRYFDYELFLRDMEICGDIFSFSTSYKRHHYFHTNY